MKPATLRAVYLCCTFPEVAFGGRYPLSLPCGARTFLMNGLSACTRDCLFYSRCLFYRMKKGLSTAWKLQFQINNIFHGILVICRSLLKTKACIKRDGTFHELKRIQNHFPVTIGLSQSEDLAHQGFSDPMAAIVNRRFISHRVSL